MDMRHWFIVVFLLSSATVACSGTAAKRAPQPNLSVAVLMDSKVSAEPDPNIARERESLAAWMAQDLVKQLSRAGYQAGSIAKREQFAAVGNAYMLTVGIVDFRPVAGSARFWYGPMAGATTLTTHFELWGASSEPLLARDGNVGSTSFSDSNKCAAALNKQAVTAVSMALSASPVRSPPAPAAAAPAVEASSPTPSDAPPSPQGSSYSADGLAFLYDPSLTPKASAKTGVLTVALTGKAGLGFTIEVADRSVLSGEDMAESILGGVRGGLSGSGIKVTEVRRVNERIGDSDRPGQSFSYALESGETEYRAFGWDVPKRGKSAKFVMVVVQCSSADKAVLEPIVKTTLRSLKYEPKN